jgi:hypothetical protein
VTKRQNRFGISNFAHCDLPFDLAQGGESLDFAQDREPVERLVEPFDICDLRFEIALLEVLFLWLPVPVKIPGYALFIEFWLLRLGAFV